MFQYLVPLAGEVSICDLPFDFIDDQVEGIIIGNIAVLPLAVKAVSSIQKFCFIWKSRIREVALPDLVLEPVGAAVQEIFIPVEPLPVPVGQFLSCL